MKTYQYLLLLVLVSTSCLQQKKLNFEAYPFEIKGFNWDPAPYQFSQVIQDSILPDQGPQYASWAYSYIGNLEKMHQSWDQETGIQEPLSEEEQAAFEQFKEENATSFILEEAKKTDVVIINEAHHMPQHRVFTTSLLEGLYDQGYRHLGLETYFQSSKTDSALRVNQYPVLQTGYYVKEPQFGNLVREALKIGFQVFGYESMGHESSKEREINQARNIEAYVKENPEGKYLIHCGFAHATEGTFGPWEKAMAGRLTEFSGIDPLTINQTSFSERSKKEYENPYYQLTDVQEPTVYVQGDSVFGKYRENSWFDISVFHPRSDKYDRPGWLLSDNRSIIKLNFEQAPLDCPCLIFAYVDGEEIGRAIPYDVQETNDKEVNLVLEEGKYQLIFQSKDLSAYKAVFEY